MEERFIEFFFFDYLTYKLCKILVNEPNSNEEIKYLKRMGQQLEERLKTSTDSFDYEVHLKIFFIKIHHKLNFYEASCDNKDNLGYFCCKEHMIVFARIFFGAFQVTFNIKHNQDEALLLIELYRLFVEIFTCYFNEFTEFNEFLINEKVKVKIINNEAELRGKKDAFFQKLRVLYPIINVNTNIKENIENISFNQKNTMLQHFKDEMKRIFDSFKLPMLYKFSHDVTVSLCKKNPEILNDGDLLFDEVTFKDTAMQLFHTSGPSKNNYPFFNPLDQGQRMEWTDESPEKKI